LRGVRTRATKQSKANIKARLLRRKPLRNDTLGSIS